MTFFCCVCWGVLVIRKSFTDMMLSVMTIGRNHLAWVERAGGRFSYCSGNYRGLEEWKARAWTLDASLRGRDGCWRKPPLKNSSHPERSNGAPLTQPFKSRRDPCKVHKNKEWSWGCLKTLSLFPQSPSFRGKCLWSGHSLHVEETLGRRCANGPSWVVFGFFYTRCWC